MTDTAAMIGINSDVPTPAKDTRQNLVGMSHTEILEALAAFDVERYRADQIYSWVYAKGARDFDAMTNLSKDLRARLPEAFRIERPGVSVDQQSVDGTRKWLLDFEDKNAAETVYIPEPGRGTLCVSSQVGCTLTCSFCHTGTQRLVRNLEPGEIVGQIMLARDHLEEWPSSKEENRITNIVMMGMGEPLYNYENVKKALQIAMDGDGVSISRRRITLSTSGVVPMIEQCGEELGVMLAISLHAVTDDVRDKLVPINKKYPIEELLRACRAYPAAKNARRITFEYVMLKGINDSEADARELCRLIEGIPAKVNMIPFNPWPGSTYECSSGNAIRRFARVIERAGYVATVRTPRGTDIMAACGQLKTESERVRKSQRPN
ncbi:MAG: 23S rRNA (adenine(2503)-C(2))-methyltransferase RlmN [Alphaproteobacteria bacterium]|jgi:23S rRNA (adenine2503-C2)-methyltransferase|nr:23S rRNA (adenine(2503)-C(2))-methyltransferase RlmN [Alphaproteobacteria bacterium]